MQKMTEEEIKSTQLNILDAVAHYCEEHGLRYWLDSGTLLGAIRHNGYIPWDDDIDIGMCRQDYDYFLKHFNDSSEKYKAYSIENDKHFYFPFIKVMDMSTVLYEPDENGKKLSVNIDVFAYDNAPDETAITELYDKRDFFRKWEKQRLPLTSPGGNGLRKAFIYLLRIGLKIFPSWYFTRKIVQNAKTYYNVTTDYVGCFTCWSRREYFRKIAIRELVSHEFEGKEYKIPIGYDEVLTTFYGDYMQLPPVEERETHHSYVAYKE